MIVGIQVAVPLTIEEGHVTDSGIGCFALNNVASQRLGINQEMLVNTC